MRLLIIGRLGGHISIASKIAIAHGANVNQVDDIDSGLRALRAGQGAEMVMADMGLGVAPGAGVAAAQNWYRAQGRREER